MDEEILLFGTVALAVVLLINGIVAKEFEKIAGEKGYSGYFRWCFLLGIAGWIMVAALPNSKAPAPAAPAPSQAEEISRLSKLHDQGVLSDEEYEFMKGKTLGER